MDRRECPRASLANCSRGTIIVSRIRAAISREPIAVKVPEITLIFWVIKILTTGMGEAASDYFGQTSRVLGAIVGTSGLAAAMWLQLKSRRYRAPTYWFAVGMVAVFGTMAADALHLFLGLSYYVTSALYGLVVAGLFVVWHRAEGTLSIHSITSVRRERFYWCTVLATFALGTAVGDLTGLTLHLGFFASGLLFLGLILIPLIAWRLGLNPVIAFWTAYVLTRPLGASFADWLAKPPSVGGGLGYGEGTVTVVSLAFIIGLVAYVARTESSLQGAPDRGLQETARS